MEILLVIIGLKLNAIDCLAVVIGRLRINFSISR